LSAGEFLTLVVEMMQVLGMDRKAYGKLIKYFYLILPDISCGCNAHQSAVEGVQLDIFENGSIFFQPREKPDNFGVIL
jgi:hypothetical protein